MSKTTTIQKGGNIKPAVISDKTLNYNPLESHNKEDPKMIEELVRAIGQLDKAYRLGAVSI